MTETIIVSLITLCGSVITALISGGLVNYRLTQLEKKVEKHNSVVERVFVLEGKMNEVEHDIRDLKND